MKKEYRLIFSNNKSFSNLIGFFIGYMFILIILDNIFHSIILGFTLWAFGMFIHFFYIDLIGLWLQKQSEKKK